MKVAIIQIATVFPDYAGGTTYSLKYSRGWGKSGSNVPAGGVLFVKPKVAIMPVNRENVWFPGRGFGTSTVPEKLLNSTSPG